MLFLLLIFFSISFTSSFGLTAKVYAEGLSKPVYVTSLPDNSSYIYIVEQSGVIKVSVDGKILSHPFLDITDRVHNPFFPGDERGLLGFTFSPSYKEDRKFFVNYIDKETNNTIIASFFFKSNIEAEPKSEIKLLNIKQPYFNHNGGQIEFDSKGNLYIGLGDGGSAGDPESRAQNMTTLLGKILRIRPSETSYTIPSDNPYKEDEEFSPEIWLYGLRNPWRFSFDRKNGGLYIADVGQNSWEEIHFFSSDNKSSRNMGWNIMEASHCFSPKEDCDTKGLNMPIFEYANDANYIKTLAGFQETKVKGCSITGGYVYRGNKIKALEGYYIFGDYCSGRVWAIDRKVKSGKVFDITNELYGEESEVYISSFGQDSEGELYVVDHAGTIYKIFSN